MWLDEPRELKSAGFTALLKSLQTEAATVGWLHTNLPEPLTGSLTPDIDASAATVAVLAGHGDNAGGALKLRDGWWSGPDVPMPSLRLAVLLACFGGRIRPQAPLDLGGLVVRFLASGVRSVVAPKWPVEGTSGAAFVESLVSRVIAEPDVRQPHQTARLVHATLNEAFGNETGAARAAAALFSCFA